MLVSLEYDAEKSSWVCKISYWLLAIGYWLLALALMIRAARVPTIQMIKEYFGVAVVSEPWMAKRRS